MKGTTHMKKANYMKGTMKKANQPHVTVHIRGLQLVLTDLVHQGNRVLSTI